MSAEPLTREERAARVEDAESAKDREYASFSYAAHAHAALRWEATVRAAEKRAERAEENAAEWKYLIDYAMLLHENGEAPPGHELATWNGWYDSVREFSDSLKGGDE